MKHDIKPTNIDVLHVFINLIGAQVLSCNTEEGLIKGKIGWEGEQDIQDFEWDPPREGFSTGCCIRLIEYIVSNNLVHGDRLTISKESLERDLKDRRWIEDDISLAINSLISIRIPMVDNGYISDYFYVHF